MYIFASGGANVKCSRFLAADLTGEQVMTVPALACTSTLGVYTDGANAYVTSAQSSTTTNKWTLSGTTFTASTTASTSNLTSGTSFFDGTNIYIQGGGSSGLTIYKLTAIDGSAKTTTSKTFDSRRYSDAVSSSMLLMNIDTTRMYFGFGARWLNELNADVQIGSMIYLLPISKP